MALDFADLFPQGLRNWEDAERLGLALMLYLGFADAKLTAKGADAGIDVAARDACCQVKHWVGPVGRRELQQLVGASFGRTTVFLASSYSAHAIAYADAARVGLFALNPTARVLVANAEATVLASRPQHAPMTEEQSAITTRHSRAMSDFDVICVSFDSFSALLLASAGTTRRSRKDASRRLARISQWLKNFEGANSRLVVAARTGSNPKAERALSEMENAVRTLAHEMNLRLPD